MDAIIGVFLKFRDLKIIYFYNKLKIILKGIAQGVRLKAVFNLKVKFNKIDNKSINNISIIFIYKYFAY